MSTLVCSVVLLGSVIAIATDLREFKVYNALTVPMLLGGILYHALTGGWSGLLLSLAGLSVGFVVLLFPMFLARWGLEMSSYLPRSALGLEPAQPFQS